MSRLMTLNVAVGVQLWLLNGGLVAAAIGLVFAGAVGREAGMPSGWYWLSLVSGALVIAAIIASTARVFPVDVVLAILIGGVLIPVWAAWLATRARDIWRFSS